jgi:hypothetical protein
MAHVIIDRSDAVKKRLAIVGAADGWWSECGGRNCRRHLCSNTQHNTRRINVTCQKKRTNPNLVRDSKIV